MTTNKAYFDVDGDGLNVGVVVANSQEVALSLRSPALVGIWQVQVYDASAYDPNQPITGNPPKSSKGAPSVTLTGTTTGTLVRATSPSSDVGFEAPSSGIHSYIVRSIVDGGMTDGRIDPSKVFERMIVTVGASGLRKPVVTESLQYGEDSWAQVIADIVDAVDDGIDIEVGGTVAAVRDPVKTLARENHSRIGLATLNGATLSAGDPVFLMGQTDGRENGPYLAAAGGWTRREDWDVGDHPKCGVSVLVNGGDFKGSQIILETEDPITVGTTVTSFIFAKFTEGGLSKGLRLVYIDPTTGDIDLSPIRLSEIAPNIGQTVRARDRDGETVLEFEDGSSSVVQTEREIDLPAADKTRFKGFGVRPGSGGVNEVDAGKIDLTAWGANGLDDKTPSTYTGTAGSATITVAHALFQDGDTVALYEGGASAGLATPAAPTVVVQGTAGAIACDIKIAAYTAEGARSAFSPVTRITNCPTTLAARVQGVGAETFLQVWPATPIAGAYGYIVVAERADTGGLVYRTSFLAYPVAQPLRNSPAFADYANRIGDSGRIYSNTAPSTRPIWAPANDSGAAVPNLLKARVLSGGGTTTLVLDRPLVSSATGAPIAHDIRLAIEDAERTIPLVGSNGRKMYLPPGTYRLGGVQHIARCHNIYGAAREGKPECGLTIIQQGAGAGWLGTHAGFAPQYCPGEIVRVGDRRTYSNHNDGHVNKVIVVESIGGSTATTARASCNPASSPPTWSYTHNATFTDGAAGVITWRVQLETGPTAIHASLTGVYITQEDTTAPVNRVVSFDDWLETVNEITTAHRGVWDDAILIPTGGIVLPTAANQTGFYYQNAGAPFTTGATEPTWSKTIGGSTSDNGGTWTTHDQKPDIGAGPCIVKTIPMLINVALATTRGGLHATGDAFTGGSANFSRDRIVANGVVGNVLHVGFQGSQGEYYVECSQHTGWAIQDISLLGNAYKLNNRTGNYRGLQSRKTESLQSSLVVNVGYSEGNCRNSWWLPSKWSSGVIGVPNEGNGQMDNVYVDTLGSYWSTFPVSWDGELLTFTSGGVTQIQRDDASTFATADGEIGRARFRWDGLFEGFKFGEFDGNSARVLFRLPQYSGFDGLVFPNGIATGYASNNEFGRQRAVDAIPAAGWNQQGDVLTWCGPYNTIKSLRASRDGAYASVARADSTAYTVNTVVRDVGSNRLHVCTAAGTSAGSPPAAMATAAKNARTKDGTVRWKCVSEVVQTPGLIAEPNFDQPPVALGDNNNAIVFTDGVVYLCDTLTANRTKALPSATGQPDGLSIKISRRSGDAFTLDVGGVVTMPATTNATVIVVVSAETWVLGTSWTEL